MALELAEAEANDGDIARALEAAGDVCLEAGEGPEAAEYYSRAMQQGVEGSKLRLGDGRVLLKRARACIQMADWEAAEGQLEAAIKVRLPL